MNPMLAFFQKIFPPGIYLFAAILTTFAVQPWGLASRCEANITIAASSGYSSNPTKLEDSEGSGFYQAGISYVGQFAPAENFNLSVAPDFTFRNYWKADDRYESHLETILSYSGWGNGISPYLNAGVAFYRDDVIETDERNVYWLGIGAEWPVSGRFTLLLEHAWTRSDYLSDAEVFARGPRYRINRSQMAGGGMNNPVFPAKDDLGMTVDAAVEIFLSPSWTATAGVGYERVDSSVDPESYQQITPGGTLLWNLSEDWRLMADFGWEHRNYSEAGRQDGDIRKINDTRVVQARVSRYFEKVELFAAFFSEKGEYPLHSENYRENEVQCGLSWSF